LYPWQRRRTTPTTIITQAGKLITRAGNRLSSCPRVLINATKIQPHPIANSTVPRATTGEKGFRRDCGALGAAKRLAASFADFLWSYRFDAGRFRMAA
jgi:hypothetical protein